MREALEEACGHERQNADRLLFLVDEKSETIRYLSEELERLMRVYGAAAECNAADQVPFSPIMLMRLSIYIYNGFSGLIR